MRPKKCDNRPRLEWETGECLPGGIEYRFGGAACGPAHIAEQQGINAMQAKLITTFSALSEADFLAKSGAIVNGLRINKSFPEPWLPQVDTHKLLEADYLVYQTALNAASTGDRIKAQDRDRAREVLTARLQKLAPYLEVVADGDVNKLMSTGYDLRREGGGGSTAKVLDAPNGFTAKHGMLSGSVLLHAVRLIGAKSYEAQHNEGDPRDESTWQHAGTFSGCNKIEIGSLTPGKSYWFRLRAINAAGPGAWTDPASLMVV
jgi:hypothetical protein